MSSSEGFWGGYDMGQLLEAYDVPPPRGFWNPPLNPWLGLMFSHWLNTGVGTGCCCLCCLASLTNFLKTPILSFFNFSKSNPYACALLILQQQSSRVFFCIPSFSAAESRVQIFFPFSSVHSQRLRHLETSSWTYWIVFSFRVRLLGIEGANGFFSFLGLLGPEILRKRSLMVVSRNSSNLSRSQYCLGKGKVPMCTYRRLVLSRQKSRQRQRLNPGM